MNTTIRFLLIVLVASLSPLVASAEPRGEAPPPSRVISTSPAVTELLFEAGFGAQVVGVTALCDFPPEVARVEKVGDLALDFEKMVALRPDLVVVMEGLRPGEASLEVSLGLRVLELSFRSLADIPDALDRIGVVFGRAGVGDRWRATLAAETARCRPDPAHPVRVYVETWDQPPMSVGSGSFLSDLVVRAGGRPLFADRPEANFQVAAEEILARDPDVVLLLHEGSDAAFRLRPFFSGLRAAQTGAVHNVRGGPLVRPCPRTIAMIGRIHVLLRGRGRPASGER